jgi:hypothetical protein
MEKTKYRYAVIEKLLHDYSIIRYFDDFEEAKDFCYKLRINKYANHDRLKEIEYEKCPFDNGYNVVKISDEIY